LVDEPVPDERGTGETDMTGDPVGVGNREDFFGRQVRRVLDSPGADHDGMLPAPPGEQTDPQVGTGPLKADRGELDRSQ